MTTLKQVKAKKAYLNKPNTLYIIWDNEKIVTIYNDRRVKGRPTMPGHKILVEAFPAKSIEKAKLILDKRNTNNIYKAIYNDSLTNPTKLV